ncbi:hypothetical protein BU16DRAFT_622573 [Lophium mytilinum]|uniref:CBM-cenC domain-containing protein n=1 Tax=Lophium mytilinum TaxID=390894 RepID=A0A6A6QD54_9PEZI|nr:hypothetical protein BU16DRAFT_622573 [Lophium mytilinum]
MRFAVVCAAVPAISFVSGSLASAIGSPLNFESPSLVETPTTTLPPGSPELLKRASKTSKRHKPTRRPQPHPKRPQHHPTGGCSDTELVKNGDFNRNVKGWEFLGGGGTQFFWIKSSKKRPAHSGAGQGYLFLPRGYSTPWLSTAVPAIEYGNTYTVSAWLQYEAPNDLSQCTIIFTDNGNESIDLVLTPEWTKFSFDSPGTGRPIEVQLRITCESTLPLSIYIDDVSAKACIPRNPNPACQALPRADNALVNPGFECPDGITAWNAESYYGSGNDSIVQVSGKKGNPTHSGNGMAALLFDNSVGDFGIPLPGVLLYQSSITDDTSRQFMKASLWLSADSRLNNVSGCLLYMSSSTSTFFYDFDISTITTKWTKFEANNIEPSTYDYLYIGIYQCDSDPQPIIYLDDIYFGKDPTSPPAPVTSESPQPTPTSGPCTTTPNMVDPSFELGNLDNWLFHDQSFNFDTTFSVDSASTYGPPHAGSGVGVLTFASDDGSATIMQQIFGLCDGVYTTSVWFYVPVGYDASLCTFSYGVFASASGTPTAAGVWTKVEVVFLVQNIETTFPYTYISANCQNTGEMVVLVDDITFGPPPACSVVPTISDGSFESGDVSIWDAGFGEGDETFAITTAKAHTGKKSGLLTFPSTSNSAVFSRDFDACVGGKYTFHLWYYVPKAYKSSPCSVNAFASNSEDYYTEDVAVWDKWVEYKLDFVAGAAVEQVDFGVSCLNRLGKAVIYLDDMGITVR